MNEKLAVAGLEKELQDVFTSDEELDAFREEFRKEMAPILEEQREASLRSEDDLRKKLVFRFLLCGKVQIQTPARFV